MSLDTKADFAVYFGSYQFLLGGNVSVAQSSVVYSINIQFRPKDINRLGQIDGGQVTFISASNIFKQIKACARIFSNQIKRIAHVTFALCLLNRKSTYHDLTTFQRMIWFIGILAIIHEIYWLKYQKRCLLNRNFTKFFNFKAASNSIINNTIF